MGPTDLGRRGAVADAEVMTRQVVVLGGGTGGTIAANRLRKLTGDDVAITVVDQDDDHIYQPGLLFVPFGETKGADLVRPRARQLRAGIRTRSRTRASRFGLPPRYNQRWNRTIEPVMTTPGSGCARSGRPGTAPRWRPRRSWSRVG
jgi:hypothetical protein